MKKAEQIYSVINKENSTKYKYIVIANDNSTIRCLSHPNLTWLLANDISAIESASCVYYYLNHSKGSDIEASFKSAIYVISDLISQGIKCKVVYDVQGSNSTRQGRVDDLEIILVSLSTFLIYCSCIYTADISNLLQSRSQEHSVASLCDNDSSFCSPIDYLLKLSLVNFQPDELVGSFIPFWIKRLANRSVNLNVVHILEDEDLDLGIEPYYYSLPREYRIERNYHRINLHDNDIDILTEGGQMQISSDLIRIESEINSIDKVPSVGEIKDYNKEDKLGTISLVVLDNLSSISNSPESVFSMRHWLELLRERGIGVILVSPDTASGELLKHNILQLPWDNVISIEKEYSYDNNCNAISLHYDKKHDTNIFIPPETWEYNYNILLSNWKKVLNREAEEVALRCKLRKYVKSKLSNKEIAALLNISESLVKKYRKSYGLSKPQKNRRVDLLKQFHQANKNAFTAINKFLRQYSYNVRDALGVDYFDDIIISLHRSGLSQHEISDKLEQEYGIRCAPLIILKETNDFDDAEAFMNRTLSAVYPVIFFKQFEISLREGKANLIVASGVNVEGDQEVVGMWVSDKDDPKIWCKVFAELSKRGVKDILIACSDDIAHFTKALIDIYPATEVQLYIEHLIYNSLRLVKPSDHKSNIQKLLKKISTVSTRDEAEKMLVELSDKWGTEYPNIVKLWNDYWNDVVNFLDCPDPIRKAIDSSQYLEKLSRSLRRVAKSRSNMARKGVTIKLMVQAFRNPSLNKNALMRNWEAVLNQFAIRFDGRLPL